MRPEGVAGRKPATSGFEAVKFPTSTVVIRLPHNQNLGAYSATVKRKIIKGSLITRKTRWPP